MDEGTRDRLLSYDTGLISDALDELGLSGVLVGLRTLAPGHRVCGEAFTVRFVPAGDASPAVADYLDQVERGQVVVIDNAGRVGCGVWGGLTTAISMARGIGGTVVDGACRDVTDILGSGYPVFAKGTCPASGRGRVLLAATGEAVDCGGARVHPGDVIVGDDTGVVAIPRDKVRDVLVRAEGIRRREEGVISALAASS